MEVIAAAALRRLPLEVRFGDQPLQQIRLDGSAGSVGPGFVERQSSLMQYPRVHQAVGWTGVESLDRSFGWQQGQVADAAEIEHRAILCWAAQYAGMESRNQRRPLTTRSHVAAAEVGDRGDAADLGDQRRIADLHREWRSRIGTMSQRLPVGADRGHGVGR